MLPFYVHRQRIVINVEILSRESLKKKEKEKKKIAENK